MNTFLYFFLSLHVSDVAQCLLFVFFSFFPAMCDFKCGTLKLNGARDHCKRAALFKLIEMKKLK